MKKTIILIVVFLVVVGLGIVGGYVYYVLPHKKVVAEPIERVMIPEIIEQVSVFKV